MKKKELIERIAQEAGVPKSEAQKHFEAFSAGNALKEAV
jgi:nucleoid DNA-binding protein